MNRAKKAVSYFLLFACVMALSCVSVSASTSSKLQDAQNDKKKAEQKADKTKDELDDMIDENSDMEQYLDELNDKMNRENGELQNLEDLIEEKNQGMADLQEGLIKAKENEKIQYEAMKKRIRFMYEKGDAAYLQMFFSAESFADFLNKSEYVEMLSASDRKMLEDYMTLQDHILIDEQMVADEMVALDALKEQALAAQEEVFDYVAEARQTVQANREAIYKKEQELLAYEKKIEESESTVASLEKQLKEEQAITAQSLSVGFNDLSSITLSGGDLDLMAAIIYCEAGNQPYVGQVAVGNVVMNRVKSPLFPNTVLEVLYQRKQFSPVGSGRFAVVYGNHIANEQCYNAARDAMSGSAPVGNCLFFRTPIPGLVGTQIGGHIFY